MKIAIALLLATAALSASAGAPQQQTAAIAEEPPDLPQPLPLLLQRCRRLVASSFLEIVRELAPDALSQIRVLTGNKED